MSGTQLGEGGQEVLSAGEEEVMSEDGMVSGMEFGEEVLMPTGEEEVMSEEDGGGEDKPFMVMERGVWRWEFPGCTHQHTQTGQHTCTKSTQTGVQVVDGAQASDQARLFRDFFIQEGMMGGSSVGGEKGVSVEVAEARVRTLIGGLWADKTVDQRRKLWGRFVRWAAQNNLAVSDGSAVLFVAATGVSPQSSATYCRALAAVLALMDMPTAALHTAARAASAQVSGEVRQARPVSPQEVGRIACSGGLDLRVRVTVLLAWKSASRWSDVAGLRPHQFVLCTKERIVLCWKGKVKARRGAAQFRPSAFADLRGEGVGMIYTWLKQLDFLKRGGQLCGVSTKGLVRVMQGAGFTGVTGHSFRRGAYLHLLEVHARFPSLFSLSLLSRLMKHQGGETVPQEAVRYGWGSRAGKVALSRVLGTGKVTIALSGLFRTGDCKKEKHGLEK